MTVLIQLFVLFLDIRPQKTTVAEMTFQGHHRSSWFDWSHTVYCYVSLQSQDYTVSQRKHVTTFSTITLTISVRLQ